MCTRLAFRTALIVTSLPFAAFALWLALWAAPRSTPVYASVGTPAHLSTERECDKPLADWIFCDDFESDRSSRYFEYTNAGGRFERTAGVGRNGSWGMRARYVPGVADAGSLKVAFGRTPSSYFRPVDAGKANYREIYWRVYVRTQAGWIGGGGDKLSRALALVTPQWAEAALANVWSGGPGPASTRLLLDPASGTDRLGYVLTTKYNDFSRLRWLGYSASVTPIFDGTHVGQWYCVETHARLNDPGASNGVFELWINDRLEAHSAGLNWVGGYKGYGINAVFFENYWNAGPPVAEERYLDDLVVSTARIGCSQ